MGNQAIELHSLLENETREALGGKDAFLLTGSERVWFITRGSVDLFSVETQEDRAIGSRDHVARIPASELMFSFPSKGNSVAILAVPGPGTEIVETSLEKLNTLSQKVVGREALASLVETWIEHITTRIVSTPPGNELTPLAAGSEEQFRTADSVVSPSSGLIWIKHIDGGSQLFGEQSCRLNGKEHFPLTEQGWITPDAGTRIISIDTPDLIATGDAWKGLKSFHAIALALIAHRRNADAKLEDQRISQKRQIRSRAFHDGLKSLADILSTSAERIGPPPEDLTDPLYAALCIIGKPLGMTFKPHPDARSGKDIVDPLRGILQPLICESDLFSYEEDGGKRIVARY